MRRGAANISAEDKPPNPIYERFTRRSRWPPPRRARWLAVGLMAACTMLMVWLSSALNPYQLLGTLILLSGLAAISPVVLSVAAVNLTYRLLTGIDYQMLRLTTLSDEDVLEGFARAACSRLRIPRAISIGLAVAAGLLLILGTRGPSYQPGYTDRIIIAIIDIGFAVVVLIAQAISIWLGVNLALQHSSRWVAMFLAVGLALFASAMLYFLGGYFTVTMLSAFLLSILVF